jgi:hypothetical protein
MRDCGITNYRRAGATGYLGNANAGNYPLPYLDYTSTAVPATFSELLDWSEFMYLSQPEIRELFKRLFNYFNTDIEINPVDPSKQQLSSDDVNDWSALLTDDLQWNTHVVEMLDNMAVYGQDFLSVVAPIIRYLRCPHCGQQVELEHLAKLPGSDFKYQDNKFVARCMSTVCRKDRRGVAVMEDKEVRVSDATKFKIKHWPVREIILHHYEWTNESKVFWKIPERYKRAVAFGDLHTLKTADRGVLNAIHKNVLFEFNPGRIFHAKEPVLSGLQTGGWSLPRTIYLARQAWTLQILRKNIQAIGLDFVVPLRILSPADVQQRGQHGAMVNPATMMRNDDFSRLVRTMQARHRMDPTKIHSVSVPIDYKFIGGEASQLFPAELHQMAKDDLLDAGGFPVDIYKANLTIQSAPVGLRLFESQNRAIPHTANHALQFVADRISELAGKDPIRAKHERVTLVDNLELTMTKLQLAMQGSASMTNALKSMGMNYEKEMRQQLQDQKDLEALTREYQEEMAQGDQAVQQMQMAMQPQVDPATGQPIDPSQGGQAGGAMPGMVPAAPQLPSQGLVIPEDIQGMEAAMQQLAQVLGPDPAARQRELSILQTQNPSAHGILRTRLEQFDNQMRSQGKDMLMQGGM